MSLQAGLDCSQYSALHFCSVCGCSPAAHCFLIAHQGRKTERQRLLEGDEQPSAGGPRHSGGQKVKSHSALAYPSRDYRSNLRRQPTKICNGNTSPQRRNEEPSPRAALHEEDEKEVDKLFCFSLDLTRPVFPTQLFLEQTVATDTAGSTPRQALFSRSAAGWSVSAHLLDTCPGEKYT